MLLLVTTEIFNAFFERYFVYPTEPKSLWFVFELFTTLHGAYQLVIHQSR